jgi:hypothetical protein
VAKAAQRLKGPTPWRLKRFVLKRLALGYYLQAPGDGRLKPQIPAAQLLWSLLIAQLLRAWAFHAIESLVAMARRALAVSCSFGDDTLAYFTERLHPGPTRAALLGVVRRAKRNKAFEETRFIGLALDGTGAGRSKETFCPLCHPVYDTHHTPVSYLHHLVAISVVGTGLTLPVDIEPYGPHDSEYEAGRRLLERVIRGLGVRFADYAVVDSLFATAPFLHTAGDLGLRVVARLKGNLPDLFVAAQARFGSSAPTVIFQDHTDSIEVWDAEDFDPWEGLRWSTVRVLRYRQHKPDGTVVEAYWLTDFPSRKVGPRALYRIAKSRWEIENQVFNDGKNRYGLEHIAHHHPNSLLIRWLLICLALTVERLYRLRYLHRGDHAVYSGIEFVRRLWISLGSIQVYDTS